MLLTFYILYRIVYHDVLNVKRLPENIDTVNSPVHFADLAYPISMSVRKNDTCV